MLVNKHLMLIPMCLMLVSVSSERAEAGECVPYSSYRTADGGDDSVRSSSESPEVFRTVQYRRSRHENHYRSHRYYRYHRYRPEVRYRMNGPRVYHRGGHYGYAQERYYRSYEPRGYRGGYYYDYRPRRRSGIGGAIEDVADGVQDFTGDTVEVITEIHPGILIADDLGIIDKRGIVRFFRGN